jgi:teichuronic acid biosynthesis glycosyltransferase TuaC
MRTATGALRPTKMKLLTFSTLYPNAANPSHGIFVESRLRHLLASGNAQSIVVAPVPWFVSSHPRWGKYAAFARAPREEKRHGIAVLHPRYPALPKVGMSAAPFLLAWAMKPVLKRILQSGYSFDVIDAHYFYPDGVAAMLVGKHLGKPVVITARGTDINLLPKFRLPRKMIQWAAMHSAGVITVCNALKDALIGLGVPPERMHVLRNGVDLELFQPVDRVATRNHLGMSGTTLLSVGHLVPLKGHDILIKALPMLPNIRLLLVGDGPEEQSLRRLTAELQLAERVQFLGTLTQEKLKAYYGSVDALVLASSREGWPNVLLESMACGTPVIASNVGGIPEIVTAPEAGVLMAGRSPGELAQAVRELLANYPDHDATRRYAESFGWDETTQRQLALFEAVLRGAG